ncbi:hypothetical protein [Sessilibacter corallicola]|uniref:hypothetical protein n=1 Tax=Sessilibacter corallicola TaxID=2904075 RepID=UPI001E626460|nr:hypothetical protein [Sessilibacter corallicola]MCE2030282.1 hypothetical protein [Sessilibacter corallicola]
MIDEMVIEGCSIQVNKVGSAKYLFEILEEKNFKFELWTTQKGFIEFNLISADIPDWLVPVHTNLTAPVAPKTRQSRREECSLAR